MVYRAISVVWVLTGGGKACSVVRLSGFVGSVAHVQWLLFLKLACQQLQPVGS